MDPATCPHTGPMHIETIVDHGMQAELAHCDDCGMRSMTILDARRRDITAQLVIRRRRSTWAAWEKR